MKISELKIAKWTITRNLFFILAISIELKFITTSPNLFHYPFRFLREFNELPITAIRFGIIGACVFCFAYSEYLKNIYAPRKTLNSWNTLVYNIKTLNEEEKIFISINYFLSFFIITFLAAVSTTIEDGFTNVTDVFFVFLWILKSVCLWISSSIYGLLELKIIGRKIFQGVLILFIILDILFTFTILFALPLRDMKGF